MLKNQVRIISNGSKTLCQINQDILNTSKTIITVEKLSNHSRLNPEQREKINLNFYFHNCDASKGFMKALKAFIKSFEAPQRSMKTKI